MPEEIFPDVFHVMGGMHAHIDGLEWHFGRNMTVVREDDRLVLVNSVRLDDAGLVALEGLGRITDIVRLGSLHGRDDAFYQRRYGARLWQLPGMPLRNGAEPDRWLAADGPLPLTDADLFVFQTPTLPEAILRVHRAGGILIACDALQNWCEPDPYTSSESCELMTEMGFYTSANVGPVWIAAASPGPEDFASLKGWSFRHVLCGHGTPLRYTAQSAFAGTFERLYGV